MDDIFECYDTPFQHKCDELISEISEKFRELGFTDIYLAYHNDNNTVNLLEVEQYINSKLVVMDEKQRHDMNCMSKMLSESNCGWYDYGIGEIVHKELLEIWRI